VRLIAKFKTWLNDEKVEKNKKLNLLIKVVGRVMS